MKIRTSALDGETLVFEIEAGDDNALVKLLDGPRPNGFAVFGPEVPAPIAVIDGRILDNGLTEDHLLAVEAHELGHIHENTMEEPVAESFAVDLLEELGHMEARQILLDRGIVSEVINESR